MAFCLWWPTTNVKVLTGNPVIWLSAAVALATLYRWPAVLVLAKPTLAPVALFGARNRTWWIALGAVAVVSLLFTPLWIDYVRVILNAHNPDGIAYSFGEFPMLLLPLAAWSGRTR